MSLRYRLFGIPANRQEFLDKCRKRGIQKIFLQPILNQEFLGAEGACIFQEFLRLKAEGARMEFDDFLGFEIGVIPGSHEEAEKAAKELLDKSDQAKKDIENLGFLIEMLQPTRC